MWRLARGLGSYTAGVRRSGLAGRVRGEFDDVDVIIFGHSHASCNERIKGALMFNPGRCRDSYGLLTIAEDIKAEIVRF